MVKFVKHNKLQPILGPGLSDEQLKNKLRPQAEIASKLPNELDFLNRELTMQLAVMSLYDMVVLLDNSTSIEFEEGGKRKEALKSVLHFLTKIYSAVSDKQRGIHAVRFLNGPHNKEINLTDTDEITSLIDKREFAGVTRIGHSLQKRILRPFVFSDKVEGTIRKLKPMTRPLLVMIITDGAVEGEKPEKVEDVIKCLVQSLERDGLGTKAVAFQFARVGNDEGAKKFLKYLDDESSVQKYVDTLWGEDIVDMMGLNDEGKKLTLKLQQQAIKLLLGPIDPYYDNILDYDSTDDEEY